MTLTPDDVKRVVEANFAGIVSERRNNPGGWAFYYREVRRGRNSTRIARVTQSGPDGPARFKRSVTYRLTGRRADEEVLISRGEEEVSALFAQELKLWLEHFR